jgi:hypothetical protein
MEQRMAESVAAVEQAVYGKSLRPKRSVRFQEAVI